MFRLAFLATLVLVVLKAVGVVAWPWLYTLVPLLVWGAYLLVMLLIGLAISGAGLVAIWWANRKGLLD